MYSKNRFKERLEIIIISYAISVPFMCLIGYSYYAAYLSAYGIPVRLMSSNIDIYLYLLQAFLFIGNFISIVFNHTLLAFCIAILITLLYYFYPKLKASIYTKAAGISLGFIKSCYLLYIILTIPIVFAFFITLSNCIARQVALAEKVREISCENVSTMCISIFESDGFVGKGRVIAKSDKFIALFNDGETSIYPLKDYEIRPYRKEN